MNIFTVYTYCKHYIMLLSLMMQILLIIFNSYSLFTILSYKVESQEIHKWIKTQLISFLNLFLFLSILNSSCWLAINIVIIVPTTENTKCNQPGGGAKTTRTTNTPNVLHEFNGRFVSWRSGHYFLMLEDNTTIALLQNTLS